MTCPAPKNDKPKRIKIADDLLNVRGKNKLLQEEMEATLHDIQNM